MAATIKPTSPAMPSAFARSCVSSVKWRAKAMDNAIHEGSCVALGFVQIGAASHMQYMVT